MSERPEVITHTETVSPYIATDADFRAFCTAIHDCFIALGWARSSDTGQVDLSTVAKPAAGEPGAIYEIFRTQDDANLNESIPIYVKVAYGMASSPNANAPIILIGAGTATDGAGALASAPGTNVSTTSMRGVLNFGGQAPVSGVTGTLYAAGHSGAIALASLPMYNGNIVTGGLFYMERHLNADGSPTQYGFVCAQFGQVAYWGQNTYHYDQTVLYHSAFPQPGEQPTAGFGFAGYSSWGMRTSGSEAIDNIAAVNPVFTGNCPQLGGVSLLLVTVNTNDVPNGTPFIAMHYGEPRNFLSAFTAGNGYGYLAYWAVGSNVFGIAIRTGS